MFLFTFSSDPLSIFHRLEDGLWEGSCDWQEFHVGREDEADVALVECCLKGVLFGGVERGPNEVLCDDAELKTGHCCGEDECDDVWVHLLCNEVLSVCGPDGWSSPQR